MIEVQGLTKYYGRIKAIEDVSFQVEQGEILGFLGPNGAGKTTTMRILTGYMPATAGTCRIGGADVFENPIAAKSQVGYLPENVPLYTEFTVTEYLHFVAKIKGVPKVEQAAAVERIIGRCALESMRHRLIGKLSKGFRQRVGLAQALIHDPAVIVLDEPTIGLDPAQIREVRELIRSLGRDHTVILSTHILPEASQVCDRVVIIHQGRIVAEDTPANLVRATLGKISCQCMVRGEAHLIRGAIEADSAFSGLTLEPTGDDGVWRCVFFVESQDSRPRAVRRLVEAGVDVYEFSSGGGSLEDAFLQLTASDAAADQPQPEPSPEAETAASAGGEALTQDDTTEAGQ